MLKETVFVISNDPPPSFIRGVCPIKPYSDQLYERYCSFYQLKIVYLWEGPPTPPLKSANQFYRETTV